MPRLEWHYSTRSLLTNLGCRHSSVDSSAPSILLPGFKSQVHHLCFFIYSICAIFVMWKERKKTKSGWVWHFFLKKTAYELIRVCLTCISYLGKLIWFNPVKFDPILKTFLPSFRSSFQNSIFGSIRSLLFWQKKIFFVVTGRTLSILLSVPFFICSLLHQICNSWSKFHIQNLRVG